MIYNITIDGYIGQLNDFFGDSKYYTLADFERDLAAMPADTTEINIKINSGGGITIDGFGIFDLGVACKVPINTEIIGMCGSIATIISQIPKAQGLGGKRRMHANSDYFIHNGAYVPDSPTPHNANDLEAIKQDLNKLDSKLLNVYTANTNADLEWLKEKMAAETTLNSKEALQYGFVDEVLGQQINAYTKYRLVAITQPIKKDDTMSDKNTNLIIAALEKFEKLISGKGKILNTTIKTTEGIDIYFEGELMEGTKVFLDEAMTTPAPAGVHTIDGKLYTIDDTGTVVKVEDVAANTMAAKDAEITALKEQIAALKGDVTVAKAETETANNNLKAIETEFVALKQVIVTAGKDTPPAPINRDEDGKFAKKTPMQIIAEKRAEAAKK